MQHAVCYNPLRHIAEKRIKREIVLAKIRDNLAQLVRAAQQGDAKSTEQLLESCSQNIYYIAYKMFKNKESAEDMTQEALTVIWKRLDSLTEPDAFYGWADRVAANLCLDKLRKKGVETDPAAGEPEVYEALPEANEAMLPEGALDRSETQRLVSDIIDGLPELQRMCVLLYYFREMSVADIAKTMQCSEGTVKSRLSAAREKIRTGVLALERKDGVKLYALPLLPLLLGDSAAVWTPALMEKLLPAGVSAVGTAAAAAAADGTAKTGLGGLLETLKAKIAALSVGAKVGAGAAAAAVTVTAVAAAATAAPAIRPLPTGTRYFESCWQTSSSHLIVTLYDKDGEMQDAASMEGLSYGVVEATDGVSLSLPDQTDPHQHETWFLVGCPMSTEEQYAKVQMQVQGKTYRLEPHWVPAQQLPGVTYAQYPFLITLGEPICAEDVVTSLPDGMKITSMRLVDENGSVERDADGYITATQPLAGQYCSIQWEGVDAAREIYYYGRIPVALKSEGSAAEEGSR